MGHNENIFQTISTAILEVLPDAEVSLFGSRANNTATEESDWDILVLTQKKPGRHIKTLVHNRLFPLSVRFAAFINTIIVSAEDWRSNPAYFALRRSISGKTLAV